MGSEEARRAVALRYAACKWAMQNDGTPGFVSLWCFCILYFRSWDESGSILFHLDHLCEGWCAPTGDCVRNHCSSMCVSISQQDVDTYTCVHQPAATMQEYRVAM